LWLSALIPSTPAATEPPLTPLAEAVREALASRPEAAINKISGQINQDNVRYFRDLTKPQVDLVGSYSLAGLAGLDPINLSGFSSAAPPQFVGGYDQSLSNLYSGSFPTTEVQLRVSLPIRNRTAEANLSRSLAETRRIKNQKEQVEQAVEADVRNTMQGVQSAQMRLSAAQVAMESAEEQYNSEQRQFRAGASTLFLVQQRQSTMIAARGS
jgi:HAE1 family hydrophobic/amphiphilic exporter-1